MKKIIIFLYLCPFYINAQTDTSLSENLRIISVNEKGIDNLVKKYERILKGKNGVEGWRVQLKFKAGY